MIQLVMKAKKIVTPFVQRNFTKVRKSLTRYTIEGVDVAIEYGSLVLESYVMEKCLGLQHGCWKEN